MIMNCTYTPPSPSPATRLFSVYNELLRYMLCISCVSLDRLVKRILPSLGGWSVINVPGDGTTWGLNSAQFIRAESLGSQAFYSLTISVNNAVTEFTLEVCLKDGWLLYGCLVGFSFHCCPIK